MTHNVRTTYYTFGGQRVGMRKGDDVYWLHGDHLGSASVATNITGAVVSEVRYYPYGEMRWISGTLPTDKLFTGQTELGGLGLYDYNARMYSPSLGRFISADSTVPRPGDSQAYNRYAYARNSPFTRIDPSGHTDCAAGDSACWQNDWMWKNRWYEAHGYFWRGPGWVYEYLGQQPKFSDVQIFGDVLGEAGIVWNRGNKNWGWDELVIVTTAVVKFTHRINEVNGASRLKELLGNQTTYFLRSDRSVEYSLGTPAERGGRNIWFFDAEFASDRSFSEMYGTVVHELAHIIGDINKVQGNQTWSEAFPYRVGGLGLIAARSSLDYAGNPEYFAEALKVWTFPNVGSLDPDQAKWLTTMLGW